MVSSSWAWTTHPRKPSWSTATSVKYCGRHAPALCHHPLCSMLLPRARTEDKYHQLLGHHLNFGISLLDHGRHYCRTMLSYLQLAWHLSCATLLLATRSRLGAPETPSRAYAWEFLKSQAFKTQCLWSPKFHRGGHQIANSLHTHHQHASAQCTAKHLYVTSSLHHVPAFGGKRSISGTMAHCISA